MLQRPSMRIHRDIVHLLATQISFGVEIAAKWETEAKCRFFNIFLQKIMKKIILLRPS